MKTGYVFGTLMKIKDLINHPRGAASYTALTTKQTTMSKHDEFPTKPDYEAKYKALEQAVKDAADKINQKSLTGYRVGIESNDINSTYTGVGLGIALDIITEKTGITA